MFIITVKDLQAKCSFVLPYVALSEEAAYLWLREEYFPSIQKNCGTTTWRVMERNKEQELQVVEYTKYTPEKRAAEDEIANGWLTWSGPDIIEAVTTSVVLQTITVSIITKRSEKVLRQALVPPTTNTTTSPPPPISVSASAPVNFTNRACARPSPKMPLVATPSAIVTASTAHAFARTNGGDGGERKLGNCLKITRGVVRMSHTKSEASSAKHLVHPPLD